LRFQRESTMRTAPQVYTTRAEAERALWSMASDGRADFSEDRRYRALVLLATFASLRWGEVTALRRCDLDLTPGCVRVRAAFSERRAPGRPLPLDRPSRRRPAVSSACLGRSSQTCGSTWQPSPVPSPVRWSSLLPWALRCGGATSTGRRGGRMCGGHRRFRACIFTTCVMPETRSRRPAAWASRTSWRGWVMTANGPP
jgi:hypothetical protein